MSGFIKQKAVTTKRAHRCWGCGLEYPAGTNMLYQAAPEDKTVYSVYWCHTCERYIELYFEPYDFIAMGAILINDPKGWAAIKKEMEGEDGR